MHFFTKTLAYTRDFHKVGLWCFIAGILYTTGFGSFFILYIFKPNVVNRNSEIQMNYIHPTKQYSLLKSVIGHIWMSVLIKLTSLTQEARVLGVFFSTLVTSLSINHKCSYIWLIISLSSPGCIFTITGKSTKNCYVHLNVSDFAFVTGVIMTEGSLI